MADKYKYPLWFQDWLKDNPQVKASKPKKDKSKKSKS